MQIVMALVTSAKIHDTVFRLYHVLALEGQVLRGLALGLPG